MLKIFITRVSCGSSQRANSVFTRNGKQVTAVITLTETYLVMNSIRQKIDVQISTANGWMASSTPHIVATPLPPLKLWNTGNTCPMIAENPNTIWVPTNPFVSLGNGRKNTREVAATPLSMSKASTRRPIFHPSTLWVLLAPGFLLPYSLTSIP